jgi:hypothetical protein
MGKLSPLRRRMIEDMTLRNLSPATQARPRGREVEPLLWPIPGSPEPEGRAGPRYTWLRRATQDRLRERDYTVHLCRQSSTRLDGQAPPEEGNSKPAAQRSEGRRREILDRRVPVG